MEIVDIEALLVHNWLILRVHTDRGISGIGEGNYFPYQHATVATIETLKSHLVGKDPLRIEHHWQYIYGNHCFRAAEFLAREGAVVEEVKLLVDFELSQAAHSIVSGAEQAAYFEPFLADRPNGFSQPFATRLKANMLIPAVSYVQAQRVRRELRQRMSVVAAQFDALLTPATPTPAPRTLKHTGPRYFSRPGRTWAFLQSRYR